jgi:hypothetical protein
MMQHSNQKTVEGTSMRFVVTLDLMDGSITADDADFTCVFYIYSNRVRTFRKAEMQRMDENSYALTLDTTGMGQGRVQYQIDVTMPDGRREILKGQTFETIYDGLH